MHYVINAGLQTGGEQMELEQPPFGSKNQNFCITLTASVP